MLFSNVIAAIQDEVPDETHRKSIYMKLVPAFEDADWDNLDECMGEDPAYDQAVRELHPDWDL